MLASLAENSSIWIVVIASFLVECAESLYPVVVWHSTEFKNFSSNFHCFPLGCQSSTILFCLYLLRVLFVAAETLISSNMSWQELGLYKAQTKLPFNAFGTMAMARDVRFEFEMLLLPNFFLVFCAISLLESWLNASLKKLISFLTGVWEQLSFKPGILAAERKWTDSQ